VQQQGQGTGHGGRRGRPRLGSGAEWKNVCHGMRPGAI
jgi:hypothetical protein